MENSDYSRVFAKAFKNFVISTARTQGVTAPQMATLTGISRANIQRLFSETEKPVQTSMSHCYLICSVLGVSFAQVIYAVEQQLPESDRQRLRAVPKAERQRKHAPMSRPKPRVRVIPTPEHEQDNIESGMTLIGEFVQ